MTATRQCPRCATDNAIYKNACVECYTPLRSKRFHMDKQRIKYVHVLARQKGLDDETYRLRLQSVGVKTCKALKRDNYFKFVAGMKKLPDAPRAGHGA